MDRRQFVGAAGSSLLAMWPQFLPAVADESNQADGALRAAIDTVFDLMVDGSAEMATSLGLDKGARAVLKSKLDSCSKEGWSRKHAALKNGLAQIKTVDRAALSSSAALNYDIAVYWLTQLTRGGDKYSYGTTVDYYVPYVLSQLSGPYQSVPSFLDTHHLIANADDANSYLERLRAFARALDENSMFQRADASRGVFAPDFCLDLTLGQLKSLREQPPDKGVLAASLARRTREKGIAGAFGSAAEKIVSGDIYPALDRQIELVKELRSKAVHDAGCWRLPQGGEFYADALMNATTTTLTPAEVHKLGLEQVANLTAQIDKILQSQHMTRGSVGERLTALSDSPSQRFDDNDAGRAKLLEYLNTLADDMNSRLSQAFATLPQSSLEIQRVPVFIQDGSPNGYYHAAALDGSRGAVYYINLKSASDWPRCSLPTLTYHEGSPGHHLQMSLAQEAKDLPMLRKIAPFGAYVEGWALYAEQLADEMGVYAQDPLGKVGFLQSSLFRAVRLVVDTGIHFKRWSREQAVDYMRTNTGYARSRVEREIDRYCVWPGQACSYKIGHLLWLKAREQAKSIQGARFDLKQFHQVLLEGALPLTILEKLTETRARAG